jgi:copper(I)-binding protein
MKFPVANPPLPTSLHRASAGVLLIGALLAATCCAVAQAAPPAPKVQISDGWVRWLPSKLPAAGYMTLVNTSDKPIDLVEASSPDYGDVMLHQTVSNGSTSTMQMADKLPLPPHEKVKISPGGYHFMLSDPTRAIAPGATVQLQLRFSDGEVLKTSLPVSPPTRTN